MHVYVYMHLELKELNKQQQQNAYIIRIILPNDGDIGVKQEVDPTYCYM